MLDSQTIATVKATIPAILELGPRLTAHFYDRMFHHNPELKDVFNMSNQRNGNQREALFNAVCAYASNIENLAALGPAVEKIAQKHTTFSIQPDQYNIVGEHLLASIDELLSPGQEVLDAWGKAYGLLAGIFVKREEEIYSASEQKEGGWRGTREFVISDITPQSSVIKSFELTPVDGQPVADYRVGQYLSLWVKDPSFANQEIRQYSLTRTPNGKSYRIAVRREEVGTLSNWLHQQQTGVQLRVAPPAGDFFLDVTPETPVTLISGGVGLTPMLAMLHQLADSQHPAKVQWFHATENGNAHAFAQEVTETGSKLAQFSQHIWYNKPTAEDAGKYNSTGFMALESLTAQIKDPAMQFYICGPVAFMAMVERQLMEAGVAKDHIHYEVFGPHKAL